MHAFVLCRAWPQALSQALPRTLPIMHAREDGRSKSSLNIHEDGLNIHNIHEDGHNILKIHEDGLNIHNIHEDGRPKSSLKHSRQ